MPQWIAIQYSSEQLRRARLIGRPLAMPLDVRWHERLIERPGIQQLVTERCRKLARIHGHVAGTGGMGPALMRGSRSSSPVVTADAIDDLRDLIQAQPSRAPA